MLFSRRCLKNVSDLWGELAFGKSSGGQAGLLVLGMVLGFAAFCERREPLQCVSVWSIKFWAIFEFFLYFMLIVQFLFCSGG